MLKIKLELKNILHDSENKEYTVTMRPKIK
jgi:hypothetical protein